MDFKNKAFIKFNFSAEQIDKNLANAEKDLAIAKEDAILDVKFNYTYNVLLKAGIALLSAKQIRLKSVPGHHIKIIEALAEALKDQSITDMGQAMRSKRNLDMYSGGIEVTEKECREYLIFVEDVLARVKKLLTP